MIKKTITYVDYNGETRTEDFWFNFNKAELMEMEMAADGNSGMEKMIKEIISSRNNKRIVELFKQIVLGSFGERSPDGKRFIKSPELTEAFSQTEAYSELFMELATDVDKAAVFINGVIPQQMAEAAKSANPSVMPTAT